jgi:hypothetical protein
MTAEDRMIASFFSEASKDGTYTAFLSLLNLVDSGYCPKEFIYIQRSIVSDR